MGETAKEAAASKGGRADEVIFLPGGAGRTYEVGPMSAVFKADGAETDDRYCVSEWWLEAGQPGLDLTHTRQTRSSSTCSKGR